jgi:hypothetical protein
MSEKIQLDPEKLSQLAEQAVGTIFLKDRPNLGSDWPKSKPADFGIGIDDWLIMSGKMMDDFNKKSGANVNLTRPSLSYYRTKMLVLFVMRLQREA